MFSDNPLWGVGQGNFPYRFREYEIAYGFPDGLHGRSRAGRAAHSIFFTLLPELGIAGLIIVSLMILYVFKCTRDIRNLLGASPSFSSHDNYSYVFYLTLAIEGSLIAYLVSGIFISVLYYPSFWFLVAFTSSAKKAIS
jgi:hypothetical protein